MHAPHCADVGAAYDPHYFEHEPAKQDLHEHIHDGATTSNANGLNGNQTTEGGGADSLDLTMMCKGKSPTTTKGNISNRHPSPRERKQAMRENVRKALERLRKDADKQ